MDSLIWHTGHWLNLLKLIKKAGQGVQNVIKWKEGKWKKKCFQKLSYWWYLLWIPPTMSLPSSLVHLIVGSGLPSARQGRVTVSPSLTVMSPPSDPSSMNRGGSGKIGADIVLHSQHNRSKMLYTCDSEIPNLAQWLDCIYLTHVSGLVWGFDILKPENIFACASPNVDVRCHRVSGVHRDDLCLHAQYRLSIDPDPCNLIS